MPGNSDYVSRGKRDEYEDDSSAALGLGHSPTDPHGRKRVTLPEPVVGYDPELVGKSPDAMAEIIAQREADRDANPDIDKMMREHPGGRLPGAHSSSGKSKKAKPSWTPSSQRPDPFEGQSDGKGGVYRPHMVSGRVDVRARNALYAQSISPGEMFNVLGETLAVGVSWAQIEWFLRDLAEKRRSA